jgi:Family of unknown function (DUF6353)
MLFAGLAQTIQKAKFLVNDNSTAVLTGIGVVGTISTAYLTGRATFKAAEIIEKKEKEFAEKSVKDVALEGERASDHKLTRFDKVRLVWHFYIPPGAVCATTVTCIIVANKIASKKIAALTVASGISERAFQEYKAKVEEKLTQRQATNIRDEVAQDRVNKHPINSREVILAGTGEVLCFDMTTGRYFQSSVEEIKRAENHVNYQLNNFMYVSLSEFYDEIGLPPTSFSDQVGWNANHPVKVVISTVMSPDNRPCIAVDFEHPPITDYNRNLHD